MKTYKIVNNILGWVIFAVAAFTYCSTIEPTASFWDCPEFISTAAKLEVGHPPGAPFFMLLGNFFSQFASDPTQIASSSPSWHQVLQVLSSTHGATHSGSQPLRVRCMRSQASSQHLCSGSSSSARIMQQTHALTAGLCSSHIS